MKEFSLENGIRVVFYPHEGQTTAVSVVVQTGSCNESSEEHGVAHFIEHMLFEGTKSRSAIQISSAVESKGGEIGAYTTYDRTCFYVKSLNKHLRESVDVLWDVLSNPVFSEKSIEKEREVILSEISLRKDEPRYLQWDLLLGDLFKGYSLEHPIIGDKESVSNMTRKMLLDFYERNYKGSNLLITVVGSEEGLSAVKEFASFPGGEITGCDSVEKVSDEKSYVTVQRDISQSYLLLGYRTVPLYHEDSEALEVLRAILSRGMSGRLFDEIRNKRGLAYEVGAFHNPSTLYGFFVFSVCTQKKHIPTCLDIIGKELRREIGSKELIDAKQFLEGEFIMENEDNQNLSENLAIWKQAGVVENFPEYCRRIKAVGIDDLKRVIDRYFSNGFSRVLVEEG
ncbi:MAG: M16 family metallopeptidase [Candidatus Woesearchaeota archaeon]